MALHLIEIKNKNHIFVAYCTDWRSQMFAFAANTVQRAYVSSGMSSGNRYSLFSECREHSKPDLIEIDFINDSTNRSCIGCFFQLFLLIFSTKMKRHAQPKKRYFTLILKELWFAGTVFFILVLKLGGTPTKNKLKTKLIELFCYYAK